MGFSDIGFPWMCEPLITMMTNDRAAQTNSPSRGLQQLAKRLFFTRRKVAFVSSTSLDLADWRKQIAELLQNAGLEPLGMEQFPALSRDAFDGSARMVARSDVFVGIYARRYGTLGASQRSVTEEEYETAKKNKIPRLCFVLDDRAPWPDEWVEDEPGASRLAAFKKTIEQDQVAKRFTTLEQLSIEVTRAASEYLEKEAKRRRARRRAIESAIAVACLGLLGWLLYMQTNAYQIQRIVDTAPFTLVDDTSNDAALSYLKSLVQVGRSETALKTARHIGNARRRALALNSIAKALAQNSETEAANRTWSEAHQAAAAVDVDADRSLVLIELSRAEANSGKYEDALRTAHSISSFYYHSQAIAAIAEAQTSARKFADAVGTAAELDDKTDRALVLRQIVADEIKAGQLKAATDLAEQIHKESYYSAALRDIVDGQARAGSFEQAFSTAIRIGDTAERFSALTSLAEAEARVGRFDEALATARATDPQKRFEVLSAVALVQRESGDPTGASKTWTESLVAASKVGNFHAQCVALSAIAETQARAGSFAEATQTWEEARQRVLHEPVPKLPEGSGNDPNLVAYYKQAFVNARSAALAVIADSQTKAGRLEAAQTTVQQLDRPSDRSIAWGKISEALAKSGKFRAAHETIRKVDSGDRADFLKSIARAEAEKGRYSEAKQTAQAIQDGTGLPKRSPTFLLISQAEAQAGRWKDARQTSKSCSPADELKADAAILSAYSHKTQL
jgi:tetratricopeptide (TPR) repeat protein